MTVELILGDCIDAMKAMPDNSIDAVVTDPPYELGFMGKSWDNTGIAYQVGMWAEVLRILKPGGHLLSFGGSRTYHRMACAIEDAGFEIRDQLQWIYGSGFPKSHDVSKAIDKMAGAEREVIKTIKKKPSASSDCNEGWVRPWAEGKTTMDITSPATPEAQYWQGWGTALKPAHEPIVLARKPITGTVAKNVLAYGTGGINIDGCRVGTNGEDRAARYNGKPPLGGGGTIKFCKCEEVWDAPSGRFPANILHDGSDEVVGMFPVSDSQVTRFKVKGRSGGILGNEGADRDYIGGFSDTGSAARFFYSAKASRSERNAGLEGMPDKTFQMNHPQQSGTLEDRYNASNKNYHPTVKPIAVMRWLVRLITPPNGTVLDPFTGSGTTGIAAVLEGFDFIGIEREAEYHEIARRRIEHWQSQFQMRLPIDANC